MSETSSASLKVSKSKKVFLIITMSLAGANLLLLSLFFVGYSKGVSYTFELKETQEDLRDMREANRDLALKVTEASSMTKLEGSTAGSFVPVASNDIRLVRTAGEAQFTKR